MSKSGTQHRHLYGRGMLARKASLPIVRSLPDWNVIHPILVPEHQSQRIIHFRRRRSQEKVSVLGITISRINQIAGPEDLPDQIRNRVLREIVDHDWIGSRFEGVSREDDS